MNSKAKAAREKGVRGEVEVANLLKPIFPQVSRAWEAAAGKGYDLEGTGDYRFQIKRNEKGVPAAHVWQVPGPIPVLVQRRSREPWCATLPLEVLIALIHRSLTTAPTTTPPESE